MRCLGAYNGSSVVEMKEGAALYSEQRGEKGNGGGGGGGRGATGSALGQVEEEKRGLTAWMSDMAVEGGGV
jgi:hypothetical protein